MNDLGFMHFLAFWSCSTKEPQLWHLLSIDFLIPTYLRKFRLLQFSLTNIQMNNKYIRECSWRWLHLSSFHNVVRSRVLPYDSTLPFIDSKPSCSQKHYCQFLNLSYAKFNVTDSNLGVSKISSWLVKIMDLNC